MKLEHIAEVKLALSSGDLTPIHELTLSLAELHFKDFSLLAGQT